MDVRNYNREAWNGYVDKGQSAWTKPVSADVIARARLGEFSVLLTELKPVPAEWLPPMTGLDVLCLACGGGQQGPVFAAAGANVTVFDNAPRQLDQDAQVAKRENLPLCLVEGDMRDLSMFADASFDLVFHPVSNVFVDEVRPVWREAYRVLRPGGTMLSGFMNPVCYLFDFEKMEQGQLEVRFKTPYADVDHPEIRERMIANGDALEFGHSLTDQLAGQTEAGFHIIGLYEDHQPDSLIGKYTPTYLATRAKKILP